MRSWMLSLATLMLSGAVAAQAPVPGTFTNTPPQTTQQTNGSGNNGGYIVSPPTISYGDGITPTVVTSQDTVQVVAPQNTAINGPTVQATSPATLTPSNNQGANPANAPAQRFDFVVAPNADNSVVGGSMADDTVSLGDAARKFRNGKTISKRTLTNADVAALNAQYPGATPSPDAQPIANGNAVAAPQGRPNGPFSAPVAAPNGGTTGAVQSAEPAPAYSQPSTPEGSTTPMNTRRGAKPSARQGGNASDQDQAAPSDQTSQPQSQPAPRNNDQQTQQLPKSSSALPLLGTLGALSTLAGILYFKMR